MPPQFDQVVDNAPGLAVRTDINAGFAALFSGSSGPVEPVVKSPGQLWFDTSSASVNRLAVRDQNNALWLNIAHDSGAGSFNTLAAGDSIEATGPNAFAAVSGGAVHRAGDTMTGKLTITKPYAAIGDEALTIAPTSGSANIVLSRTGVQSCTIQGRNGANMRWQVQLGNPTAEGGSNAGADFVINRYNDAGAVLDACLTITRSNAQATFSGNVVSNLSVICSSIMQIKNVNAAFYCANAAGTVNNATFGFVGADSSTRMTNIAAANNYCLIDSSGNFIISGANGFKPGGGSWGASSDARIKTVQGDYNQGLAEVVGLHPVVYTYKGNDTPTAERDAADFSDPDAGDRVHKSEPDGPATASPHYHVAKAGTEFIGLIAQEVETVFPDMVTQRAAYIDGAPVTDLRELDTSPLIFALINAVKTLSARVEALEARP
jgi:hypothetical protein